MSKTQICGYVKTCTFVENPDFGACQNVFVGNPDLWVCQNVFFVENTNASTLRRARASVRDPRVVFAKGARTACGSAGNAIKFAREAKMLQNVTMSFDLATALEVRSVHRLSRLTPNMLRLTTPYVSFLFLTCIWKDSSARLAPFWNPFGLHFGIHFGCILISFWCPGKKPKK